VHIRCDAESSSQKKGICWQLTKCFEHEIRKKESWPGTHLLFTRRVRPVSRCYFIIKLAMYIFLLVFLHTNDGILYSLELLLFDSDTTWFFPFFYFCVFPSTSTAEMRVVNCLYTIFIIVCLHQYDTIVII